MQAKQSNDDWEFQFRLDSKEMAWGQDIHMHYAIIHRVLNYREKHFHKVDIELLSAWLMNGNNVVRRTHSSYFKISNLASEVLIS